MHQSGDLRRIRFESATGRLWRACTQEADLHRRLPPFLGRGRVYGEMGNRSRNRRVSPYGGTTS